MSDDAPSTDWFASGTIGLRKTNNYLLSTTHPDGRHKARLWRSFFGLTKGEGELLERLIREQLGQASPVEKSGSRVRRWELVIPRFRGPNGREAAVLTAWALEPGKDRPHLTTAFPLASR